MRTTSKAPQNLDPYVRAPASKAANTLLTSASTGQGLKQDLLQGETCIAAAPDVARPVMVGGFNGAWSGGAVISDNGPMAFTRKSYLSWADGRRSSVQINDLTRSIEIGSGVGDDVCKGKLYDDDCIHWDDGDVWTRVQDAAPVLEPAQLAKVEAVHTLAFFGLPAPPTSQSSLPGAFDRISIDTADYDKPPGTIVETVSEQTNRIAAAPPRKERGLCCC